MNRVKVTWNGEQEYGSSDPGDEVLPGVGRLITLQPGESAYVSEAKAAQLEDDFPDSFDFGSPEEMTDDEFAEFSGSHPVEPPEPEEPPVRPEHGTSSQGDPNEPVAGAEPAEPAEAEELRGQELYPDGESVPEVEVEHDVEGYASLTVPELKAELEKRELAVSGNKAELIARLEADDAEEE